MEFLWKEYLCCHLLISSFSFVGPVMLLGFGEIQSAFWQPACLFQQDAFLNLSLRASFSVFDFNRPAYNHLPQAL
jgi:hypothetical protein